MLGKFGSRNVYTGGGGLRALFVYGLGCIGLEVARETF